MDAVVPFSCLSPEVVTQVVDKFVLELEVQLEDKNVFIKLSQKARKWLARRGYHKKFGARPLSRIIQEHIKKPLAEELLFGKLVKGGELLVDLKKDSLIFVYPNTSTKMKKKETLSSSKA